MCTDCVNGRRTPGPVPGSLWLEFVEQVIRAREKARERNIAWGTLPADDVPLRRELQPPQPNGPPATNLPDNLLKIQQEPPHNDDPIPIDSTSDHDQPNSVSLANLSLGDDPIWKDVPNELQLPRWLSRSLLWKCPCPQPHSPDPCSFEFYMRKPPHRICEWLSADELTYLVPPNGNPEWDIHSPKLHSILAKVICHHYALDHLEKAGIYIRNGQVTRIPPSSVSSIHPDSLEDGSGNES